MGFVDNTVKKKQELVFFFEFIFFVLTFHHVMSHYFQWLLLLLGSRDEDISLQTFFKTSGSIFFCFCKRHESS